MINDHDHIPTMDILDRLDRLGQFRMRLDLSRVRRVLEDLNVPQASIPSVHVAGTNGKGSTCHMVDSIASAFPINRSLYTSPHLLYITERIIFNGSKIEKRMLSDVLEDIFSISEDLLEEDDMPTYFEMLTLAFFRFSEMKGSDLNIVEVGMGGRFDATNVLDPQAVAITSISMDHEFHLGNDVVEIAREKAGIIKLSTPVVIGPVQNSSFLGWKVLGTLLDVCSSLGCPVVVICNDEDLKEITGLFLSKDIPDGRAVIIKDMDEKRKISVRTVELKEEGPYKEKFEILDQVLDGVFPVPLRGYGQGANTAIALCLSLLSLPAAYAHYKLRSGSREALSDILHDGHGMLSSDHTVQHLRELVMDGLSRTKLPGRMEVLNDKDPLLIFDGGHNQEASLSISGSLKGEFDFQKVPVLLAMMRDKDPERYIKNFEDIAEPLIITELENERCLKADEAALRIGEIISCDIHIRHDLNEAMRAWFDLSMKAGKGFAGGSFYLYRPLMEYIKKPI